PSPAERPPSCPSCKKALARRSVVRCLIFALSGTDELFLHRAEDGGVMKAVSLGVILAITATLAHAEDMAEMISRYRREHGLSAVKTDPHLTAIAERQGKAVGEAGVMGHRVGGGV